MTSLPPIEPMARRKQRRAPKLEPSQLTMIFNLDLLGENTIDLSQVASLCNRRFYRQGLQWAVSGMKLITEPGATGQMMIGKLPSTWVFSNAWHKSYAAWNRMNNEALQEAESVRPRFLDFKIFADSSHHTAGIANNLLPFSYSGAFSAGEWESSKFVVPDTTSATGGISNFEIIATGASYPGIGASGLNAVSLIEGYAASRGLPDVVDPNTPDDARDSDGVTPENFLSALFNEGTQQDSEVIADMTAENNLAPYPFENDGVNIDTMYPGGANQGVGLQIHDLEKVTTTTVGGTTYFKGGVFPCGLIRTLGVDFAPNTEGHLIIELVPGPHRGFLAEPMQDM